MPVTLANNLIKLADLAPLVRNLNDTGIRDVKAGPQGIGKYNSLYYMFFEAVDDTLGGSGGFDNRTGPVLATATQLQGPWTIGTSLLITPTGSGTWENGEFSPSSIEWDKRNNRWVMWAHGGNNTGPRKIGVAYSTDGGAGLSWSRDSGNPILSVGAGGAFDESSVADLKIQRMVDGTYLGFYRGTNAGGVFKVGRVTGTSPSALTKTGMVISNGGVGTWNEPGSCPGAWYIDRESRIHMFVATTDAGLGYFYSDDLGVNWTQYGSNPVLSPGASGTFDLSAGDVAQGYLDGDVMVVTYGGENITDFPTNPPIRAIGAAITPARVSSAARKAKFYLKGASATYTSVSGTSMLTQTTHSVMGRFRAFRLQRNEPQYRHIYTEDGGVFNVEIFIRLEGGAGANAGKLYTFFRTPTAFSEMFSTATMDDGAWHEFLVRRISTGSWELWIDGVRHATDATNISTDATATGKAVGNFDPAPSGAADDPFRGTISDVITIAGTAVTWNEAVRIINQRIFPTGVSAAIDFPTAGTDNGSVVLVEGAPTPTLTLAKAIRPAAFSPGIAR